MKAFVNQISRGISLQTVFKILGVAAVFFGIPVVVYWGARVFDDSVCQPLSMRSGRVIVDSSLGHGLYPLMAPEKDGSAVTIRIENRSDERLSLAICNLYFPYRIFENGTPVSQNIEPESPHFDPAMIRKDFEIPAHSPPRAFRVQGVGIGGISAYLGPRETMRRQQRIAEEINSFLTLVFLALGVLMPLVSIIYKRLGALEVAVLITFVFCLLKISILDISAIGSMILSVPSRQFGFWNSMTTFGFSLSMFLIYALFFDVRPRRVFYPVLVVYTFLMLVDFALMSVSAGEMRLLPAVLLLRVFLFAWILGYAVLARKPFAKSILLLHAVSDGFVIYYFHTQGHAETASLISFYVDPAFLAFSIQFLFALVLFIYLTLIQSRDYNRLLMMRGLEHDLKIPISVIKLNHQMIQRYSLRDDDSDGRRFSDTIDQALTDLDGMLQNLKYHLGNPLAPQARQAELGPLFHQLQENHSAVCVARDIVFTVSHPENGLRAAIDPDILKRILHNLLDNAFKHGGEGLRVWMSAKARFGKVVITIRDNGVGMTGIERRKSARLFHKGDPARGAAGLGLGLHVVRNLLRQNRGALMIKSRKGEGAVITVALPRIS